MKSKQLKNGKPIDRCLSANQSPPEQAAVKELMYAVDARNYSSQVAPLQSLFPLHSGKTNIARLISKKLKLILLKLNVDKYYRRIEK